MLKRFFSYLQWLAGREPIPRFPGVGVRSGVLKPGGPLPFISGHRDFRSFSLLYWALDRQQRIDLFRFGYFKVLDGRFLISGATSGYNVYHVVRGGTAIRGSYCLGPKP